MAKKYPIGGYAPGNYECKCCTCGNQFTGDKQAVQCEPCAIANQVAGMPKLSEPILSEEDMKAWESLTVEEVLQRKQAIEWYRNPAATDTQNGLSVFIPCAEDDPRICGGYTSNDGQCLCYVRETTVPVIEQGAVWMKASQRLPQAHEKLFIKIEGTMSIGVWHPHHDLFMDDSGDFHPADQVEWLDESAGEKAEWIRVEDRLPEHWEYVMVYNTEGATLIARLLDQGWVAFFADGEKHMGGLTATHWRPLPGAPKR
jgi:hypothetical protein